MKNRWSVLLLCFLVLPLLASCLDHGSGASGESSEQNTADWMTSLPVGDTTSLEEQKEITAIIPSEYLEMAKACIDNLEDKTVRQEIAQAYKDTYGVDLYLACVFEDGHFQDGVICYGKYSDCYIFLVENQVFSEECISVDGFSYWWPSGMYICVYTGGSFINLRDAYNNQLLTRDDLAELEIKHNDLITVISKVVYSSEG